MALDWSSFLPTLIATFVGIGGAFIINEIHHNNVEKTRARRLLFLLKDEIESNLDLLQQLEKDYQIPNWVVFYDLRFVVWNSIPSHITPTLKKPKIMRDIAKFYFELQHLERKLNGIFNLAFNPNNTLITRDQLLASLNAHILGILTGRSCKSPQTIIAEIECLVKELK